MQKHQTIDQLSNKVFVNQPIRKIVSTVPSQTELLFFLGMENKISGITNFCTHPADKIVNICKIGGTKNLNISKIFQLKPDIIIAGKEENDKDQINKLKQLFPVWISDVNSYSDAIAMIQKLGLLFDQSDLAINLVKQIQKGFNKVRTKPKPKIVYLIWRDPYMTVGSNTFINDIFIKIGFENLFNHLQRYPVITIDELKNSQPEFILLPSEPYPFKDIHINEFNKICPNSNVLLVNGEMFGWYGNRLAVATTYFVDLIKEMKLNYQ